VQRGDWQVKGSLIIPEGYSVQATADTTLRFENDAVFVCNGGVDFQGTAEKPVRLLPCQDRWAGMLVLNAADSRWAYVEVEQTTGISRKGWVATGGVTFYKSPVSFHHCRFLNALGEDAVNVISADFAFKDCEFVGCRSDAFDGDFVKGDVQRCCFYDVEGDAIDISGSDVHLTNVVICRVGDKGLSVGEESRMTANSVRIDGAKLAVVSKDLSRIDISELIIRNAEIGLAAYTKKFEYGPAQISATDVTMERVPTKALVQSSSYVVVDGEEMEEQKVDVKALYAAESTN